MAFKVISSLLVWLLATTAAMTMVLHRVAAQEEECAEVAACEADAVCAECLAVGANSFNQVYEDCMSADPVAYLVCTRTLKEACCQSLGSANDCLTNALYVEAWWCTNRDLACIWSYPTDTACIEEFGPGFVSGGVAESLAPTAAAAVEPAPVPTAAPALPVAATTDAPAPPPVAALTTDAPVPPPVATPPTAPAPVAAETIEAGEVTTVTASANAFDERTDTDGCAPAGCAAGNTRDGDLADVSRWSCSSELVAAAGGAAGEECQIVYGFSEAQLVHSVAIAFLKGDTRTRTVSINVNGALYTTVESSGATVGLETFALDPAAEGVLSLGLESSGLAADEFLSVIETELQVSDGVASPPAAPTPTPAPVAAVTSAPVAVLVSPLTAAPAVAATSVPVAQVVATPGPTASGTSSRGLEITPSPSAQETAAESSASPEVTTSTADSCAVFCSDNEDCLNCITLAAENEEKYTECYRPISSVESCEGYFAEECCTATVSGIECMAIEEYVLYLECRVEDLSECTVNDVCFYDISSEGTSLTDSSDATDDACTSACLADEVCGECVVRAPGSSTEYYECVGDPGDDPCDVLFAALCCLATVSGNDCTASAAYIEFVRCWMEEQRPECSIEDMECAAISGFGIDNNDASAAAVASSYSAAVLTCAPGLAAVVAAAGW